MKRGRDSSLTGGTGDVNPQYLTTSATQSANDTTTTTQITLPIQRLPSGNRAQVMEVLKVFYFLDSTVATSISISIFLSTASFGTTTTSYSEPRVFSACSLRRILTTSGSVEDVNPFVQDLTDGAGHGIIVATDSIYAQVSSSNTSAINTVRFKILYRWKDVPLSEYIGVVQSQQ